MEVPLPAFEFASWISAEFKLYLIKEFQRLKDEENNNKQLDWNLQRTLAKINYKIHTDAIQQSLIPVTLSQQQKSYIYADEADLLMLLFSAKPPNNRVMKIRLPKVISEISQL